MPGAAFRECKQHPPQPYFVQYSCKELQEDHGLQHRTHMGKIIFKYIPLGTLPQPLQHIILQTAISI